MKTKSLSDMFGITFETNSNKQAQELRAFAERFPDETTFNEQEKEVVFNTECESFVVRADLNEKLEPVYQLVVLDYTPRKVLYQSPYFSSIDEVIAVSSIEVAKLFKKLCSPVKIKRK